MFTRVIALALLLLLSVAAAADESPLETVQDLNRLTRLAMFKAQEKQDQGRLEEAATILEEFLAENPDKDHYLLRYTLGGYHVSLDRRDLALIQYQHGIECFFVLITGLRIDRCDGGADDGLCLAVVELRDCCHALFM